MAAGARRVRGRGCMVRRVESPRGCSATEECSRVLRVLIAVLEEADGSKQSLAQDTAHVDSAGC